MSLASAMTKGRVVMHQHLEQMHPGVVTINAAEYACSMTIGEIKPEFDERSMTTQLMQRASVRIQRSVLTTCPTSSQRVLLDAKEWQIESIGSQASTARTWLLNLKRSVTKAAA